MKTTNRQNILFGAALLSISTVGSTISAQAAPRNNEVKQERREVKQARREVQQERRDVRQANSPFERRQEQQDLNRARTDLKQERQDVRQDRARANNQPVWNNRPVWNNQPNIGNRPGLGNRPNFGNQPVYTNGRAYSGTVTRVTSTQSFDINIGGNTFNVYTVSRLPLGLSAGDQVRVNGVQQYANDIRNASVSLLRNR